MQADWEASECINNPERHRTSAPSFFGLRPDCTAITVAIESPEEKKEDKKKHKNKHQQRNQDKITRKQQRNNSTSRDTKVQHARTVKHETATFPRPVLMLVAIFLKFYVADISG